MRSNYDRQYKPAALQSEGGISRVRRRSRLRPRKRVGGFVTPPPFGPRHPPSPRLRRTSVQPENATLEAAKCSAEDAVALDPLVVRFDGLPVFPKPFFAIYRLNGFSRSCYGASAFFSVHQLTPQLSSALPKGRAPHLTGFTLTCKGSARKPTNRRLRPAVLKLYSSVPERIARRVKAGMKR